MQRMFKGTLQVIIGMVLVIQLSGCILVDRDRRRHYDHPDHYDRGAGVDVRIHG